jgi:SAM-dependent methyltransferase
MNIKPTKTILPSTFRRGPVNQPRDLERWHHPARTNPLAAILRRRTPVNSQDYGESRGQCVDRYYIDQFLAAHAADVQGRVLDFFDDDYARRFGGAKVTKVEVLHSAPGNPRATIIADLARGDNLPSDSFDCILCTQVLHCIFELDAAVRTLHRILKPGGVALVTGPGIQKVDSVDIKNGEDWWRFTSLSIRRLFEEVFPRDHVQVTPYGNVLAAVAFLHGIAVEELRRGDLDYHDPDFEVALALRAVKPLVVSVAG